MPPQISIVINAYNAQDALDRQLAQWAAHAPAARAAVEWVVVDDGSTTPMQLHTDALPAGSRVHLARVAEDIPWNMPGARNLGAVLATAPWLLFHDVDHFLPPDGLALLLAHAAQLSATTLYRFGRTEAGQPIGSHINSFLCSRDGFWRAGGYDEDFAGHYGHEDSWFLANWQARVGDMLQLTDVRLDAQPRFSTPGLDRDTRHNSALIRQKSAAPVPAAQSRLRFAWSTQLLQAQAPAVSP